MISTTTLPTPSHAAEALRHSSHPALRRLVVEEDESRLVISGRVSSYYLKQMAQEAIMPMRGSRDVVNRVNVDG